jgi:hypothetical protein
MASLPAFSVFTDEGPGFELTDALGIRMVVAVLLPGAPVDASDRVRKVLERHVDPRLLPLHCSRISNPDRLKRRPGFGHLSRIECSALISRTFEGVEAASNELVGTGALAVLVHEHYQPPTKQRWEASMRVGLEHAGLLISLDPSAAGGASYYPVPSQGPFNVASFDFGPIAEKIGKTAGLGRLSFPHGTTAKVASFETPEGGGIQLADALCFLVDPYGSKRGLNKPGEKPASPPPLPGDEDRENKRRRRRVAKPQDESVTRLSKRLSLVFGAPSSAGAPSWLTPVPLGVKDGEAPRPVTVDPRFALTAPEIAHTAVLGVLDALGASPPDCKKASAHVADLGDALHARHRAEDAYRLDRDWPYQRVLPWSIQGAKAVADELVKRACTPSSNTGSSSPSALPTPTSPSRSPLAARTLVMRPVDLPPLPADLLSADERAALAGGGSPTLWLVGAGRLLRAQVSSRVLQPAAESLVDPAFFRRARAGAAAFFGLAESTLDALAAGEAPEHGAVWELASAIDDLASVTMGLGFANSTMRRVEVPETAAVLDFMREELAAAVEDLHDEIADLGDALVLAMKSAPRSAIRARLAPVSATAPAPLRKAFAQLVRVEVATASGARFEPKVKVGAIERLRASASEWLIARQDGRWALFAPRGEVIADAWVIDGDERIALAVSQRSEQLLGVGERSMASGVLPHETDAWLDGRALQEDTGTETATRAPAVSLPNIEPGDDETLLSGEERDALRRGEPAEAWARAAGRCLAAQRHSEPARQQLAEIVARALTAELVDRLRIHAAATASDAREILDALRDAPVEAASPWSLLLACDDLSSVLRVLRHTAGISAFPAVRVASETAAEWLRDEIEAIDNAIDMIAGRVVSRMIERWDDDAWLRLQAVQHDPTRAWAQLATGARIAFTVEHGAGERWESERLSILRDDDSADVVSDAIALQTRGDELWFRLPQTHVQPGRGNLWLDVALLSRAGSDAGQGPARQSRYLLDRLADRAKPTTPTTRQPPEGEGWKRPNAPPPRWLLRLLIARRRARG